MGLANIFSNMNQGALERLEAEVIKLRDMNSLTATDSFKSIFGLGLSPSLKTANAPSLLFRFGMSFIDKVTWDLREISVTQGMQNSKLLNNEERKARADYIRLKYDALLLSIDRQKPEPSLSKMDAHVAAVKIINALDEIYDRRPGLARIQANNPYTAALTHWFDTNRFGRHQSKTLKQLVGEIWKPAP